METISLRLEPELLSDIEKIMKKYRYSTKTEFVRSALRDKIKSFKHEEMAKRIALLAGSSKRKTSDEQLHTAGERVFELLEKKKAQIRS